MPETRSAGGPASKKPRSARLKAVATAPGKANVRIRPPTPPPHVAPATLAFDIGGTGLKASVLDPQGRLLVDRVRTPTVYPCPPGALVAALVKLAEPLPAYDRVSAGFPGMVREGRVLSAPHFSTASGPGTKTLPELVKAWAGFDLAGALAGALGKPVRVENDADLQGSDVVKGIGLEVVITLGTGLGSAVFYKGRLLPHMELSQLPFRKGETYDDQLGDEARRHIGNKKWSKRVALAVENLDKLLFFDHLYVGGGNAPKVSADLGPKVSTVDNLAGIEGGIKLWDLPALT